MEGGVEFWVSIDRDSGRHVIHRDSCVYTQGRDGDPLGLEWHGPYEQIDKVEGGGEQGGILAQNCQLCWEQAH